MKVLGMTAIALTISLSMVSCNSTAKHNKDEAISASLSSDKRSLSPQYACFNVNSLQVKSWLNPKFIAAIDTLQPQLLRLPGGEGSNFWDWERGGLIEDTDDLPDELPDFLRYQASRYTGGKLEDFQAGLEASNTEPIFVLNMLTSDLKSQIEMLKTARKMGMKVKYIELGNELYFGIPNYRMVFPNAQTYANVSSQWITAIKAEFPDAEIAVVGVVPKNIRQNSNLRLRNWNRSLLKKALPKAEAIVLHIYKDHGLKNNDDDFDAEERQYPFFTSQETEIILGEPFRNWKNIRQHSSFQVIPENKKIWITEYNLMEQIINENKGKTRRILGSWAHGMYATAMGLSFLEDPRVEIACNHSLIAGDSMFAAILADKKSFINPSNPDLVIKPYSLSATGSALKMLGKVTEKVTEARQINFTNSPILRGKNNYQYPALYGWIFANNENKQALIMNLSDRPLEIDLNNIFPNNTNYEQIYSNPRTLVTSQEVLDRNNGQITRGTITLPAHSITRLY